MATATRRSPRTTSSEFRDFINSHSNDIPALTDRAHPPARADPQAVARTDAGARRRRLHRDQPRHRLARDDEPGHRGAASSASSARRRSAIHSCPTSSASTDALQKIARLRKPWTTPQREWLKRIAAQTKANVVVDRAASTTRPRCSSARAAASHGSTRCSTAELQHVLDELQRYPLGTALPEPGTGSPKTGITA